MANIRIVVVLLLLLAVQGVVMDLGLFNDDCTPDSPWRYSRRCEFFSGIPEDQTFVCATIEHCCFMSLRCFGYLFAAAVDDDNLPINPLSNTYMTTAEREQYLSACPFPKCNTGYEYARECKGNKDGGYVDETGSMDYYLDPYSEGEEGPRPCNQDGICELSLPYSTEYRYHPPYLNLKECLTGLHDFEGGNTRNCMRRFHEAHRRCIKFAIGFLQGGDPRDLA